MYLMVLGPDTQSMCCLVLHGYVEVIVDTTRCLIYACMYVWFRRERKLIYCCHGNPVDKGGTIQADQRDH